MMTNSENLNTKLQVDIKESNYTKQIKSDNEELEANTTMPELIHLSSAFEAKDLKIISQNIRSTNANFDKLLDNQATISADLLLLQECWQPKKDYLMDEFDQIMTLRKDKNGGGVAIFYRKSFKCHKIKELISANVELLIAELTLNIRKNKSEHKLLITSFYIPPQADKKTGDVSAAE